MSLTSTEGKLTRLLHSVKALAEVSTMTSGGRELLLSFNRLREQVRSLLPDELLEEFDLLHPEAEIPQKRSSLDPEALMGSTELVAEAQTRLKVLHGWLEGHMEFEQQSLSAQ